LSNSRNIPAEMAHWASSVGADLDFAGCQLDKVLCTECNYNRKTFIEVYLEDYHVRPFHLAWAAL
jgi:phenylpropionate dioxygenase-like ring-hydroxylating dioxygenase large terminal subunit